MGKLKLEGSFLYLVAQVFSILRDSTTVEDSESVQTPREKRKRHSFLESEVPGYPLFT